MTYLNAGMIPGLAAVLLPLALMRIHRAGVRRVEWGATMFLEDSKKSSFIMIDQRDWILVIVRMLIIATLALALAQPVWSKTPAFEGPGLTVLVIDRSGSMSVDSGGKTRLDLARKAAFNVLAALPSGDEAAVIFAPESFGSAITSDLQQVAARIADLRQSNGRADIAASLNTAARLFQSSHAPRKNLFIISDRQALSWRDMTDAYADTCRERAVAAASPQPKMIYIPVGVPVTNCAIVGVSSLGSALIAGRPGSIEIRIRNFSSAPRVAVELTLSEGGSIFDHVPVDLPANSVTTVNRTVLVNEVGSHLLGVKIADDPFPADNSMDFAAYVQPADAKIRAPGEQNIAVGDPIVADLPSSDPKHVTIDGPSVNGSVDSAPISGGIQARFSATGRAGVYRLRFPTANGQQTLHFVVRAARDESDLTDLSEDKLRHITDRFGIIRLIEPTQSELVRQVNPSHIEAWFVLVCCALLLATVEMALTGWWMTPVGAAA